MHAEFEVEEDGTYEQPLLVEAGDYTEMTNGTWIGVNPDGGWGHRLR